MRYFFTSILSVFIIVQSYSAVIIKNEGQLHSLQIKYYSYLNGWNVFFLEDRISFVKSSINVQKDRNHDTIKNLRWDLILESNNFILTEEKKSIERFNYLKNEKEIKAESFNQLRYHSAAYDIVFYNHPENGIKYDILYHRPDAFGIKEVKFHLEGIQSIKYLGDDIQIETLLGNFNLNVPLAYSDEMVNGELQRKNIDINKIINPNEIIFQFNYSENLSSVVIDPWTSYVGGSDIEETYGTAFDLDGNSYISGYTSSTDFPTTAGVIQTNFNGVYDSYVFKFDQNGQRLWSTYYGGSNNDFGNRIVVDASNKPIVTGYSYSSDLMVSPSGVFSSGFSGIFDAFITRLNTDGTFDWGTFYGGTGGEFVSDIDIFNNELIIGGFTSSMDLPVSGSAWQNVNNGGLDIFVAKFDTTGNRIWDTYYGGTNSEDAHTLSFDYDGNIILGGDTYSNDFPTSVGAYQTSYNAGSDMYMIKFDSNGQLMWSTFLSGMSNDDCNGIDTDINNNIYFNGYSTGNDLPITSGAFQNTVSGDRDLIIGSFSPGGNLRWLTYAGGTAWDMAADIQVNNGGMVTSTGESYSSDFPETGNTFQTGNAGNSDVLLMVCDSMGVFSLSTLIGGASVDAGRALAFDQLYKTVISGNTSSSNFPVTNGVFQTTYGGQGDSFLKVIDSISGVFVAIPENIHQHGIYLFPNPSNGEIIISDLPGDDYSVRIFSMDGKLISTKKYPNSTQIRLSDEFNELTGIFLVEIQGSKMNHTCKIIRY